jgi:hypothetical protein
MTLLPIKTGYTPVKVNRQPMSELKILCEKNTCTRFTPDGKAIDKVFMKYDSRNELFRCERCPNVVSEKTVRYVMKLELPEYIHKEEINDEKKTVEDIQHERESTERFIIEPISNVPPGELRKKRLARVVK